MFPVSMCACEHLKETKSAGLFPPSSVGRVVMMGYIWSEMRVCVCEQSNVIHRDVSHCHLKVDLSPKTHPKNVGSHAAMEAHVVAGPSDRHCRSADGLTWCLLAS